MNIQKANQLRKLVEIEITSHTNHDRQTPAAYWRGVREALFTVIQLNATFDVSTPEQILDNLRATAPRHGEL